MTYKEFKKFIGNRIREIRVQKFPNKTVNALGHKAIMKGSDWTKVEEGKGNPTIKTLCRIAEVLGVEIEELCHPPEQKQKRVVRVGK